MHHIVSKYYKLEGGILFEKFLLLLVNTLFLATVLSFVFGYSNYGVGLGTILMFVAMGAARYYSISNQEYIYRNQRDCLYK